MEYFYSKYTGEELEERLDRIDDIPELLAEMLTGKNYTTPEDALCIVKKYVPTIYENIPIDNNTIYWANTNDGKVLKARIILSDTDAEGECLWEKKTNTDGKEYLYSKLPVITAEGITMYADGEGLDIPSIYAGIPFDGVKIHFNNEGKVEVIGGTEGGVSNFWDLNDIPSWITIKKPTYSYSEIEGTPDLSNYVTKSYVDDNFVTFTLDEVITGIKSFTNGLKIGESSIKQLQEDVVYIDANLVVRGGVTMYYDGEIDIPNIKDQIGPAGYNEKGLASFDQTYFTINDGHVSLIEGAVGLNENELLNYLTNNQYATQSWVESKGFALNSDLTILSTKVNDFLEGSDTDNIINKWKELESFLNGLSQSDNLATILGNKAEKTDLAKYIPIAGATEITGEKNFIGGLKINGSPIYYDTNKKYWKLEGDLLVTGGITMYGNDSEFTPSTIMDAILYDDSTLGINSQGQLYVKGGTGGGGISSITSQMIVDALGYTPASATALSGYLPFSGGTITNSSAVPLTINANNDGQVGLFLQSKGNNKTYVGWDSSRGTCLYEFASDSSLNILNGVPRFNTNTIWHSGNDGSGSGLDADLLDGYDSSYIMKYGGNWTASTDTAGIFAFGFGGSSAGLANNYGAGIQLCNAQGITAKPSSSNNNANWYSQLLFGTDNRVYARFNTNGGGWSGQNKIAYVTDNVASATNAENANKLNGLESNRFLYSTGTDAPNPNTYDGVWFGMTNQNTPDKNYMHILSCNWGVGTQLNSLNWATQLALPTQVRRGVYFRCGKSNGSAWGDWINIVTAKNIGDYNAGSATKLYTARTIWGQSFDGTSGINGLLSINEGSNSNSRATINLITASNNPCDFYLGSNNTKKWSITARHSDQNYALAIYNATTAAYPMWIDAATNNVGIGTTTPTLPFSIVATKGDVMSIKTTSDTWNCIRYYPKSGTNWSVGCDTNNKFFFFSDIQNKYVAEISANGDFLVNGGITMYSDQRKKTILNHVVLSLQQVANAPLIEHYYNSDQNKTTHVGSIAQYWAEMNDWFCKKDSEGYYTMEIQNAALASAISVARELVKFESETDRRIRLLEEENKRLKEEVEQLKWNIA